MHVDLMQFLGQALALAAWVFLGAALYTVGEKILGKPDYDNPPAPPSTNT